MHLIADFLSGSSPWVYAFIFLGKLTEVALTSLRQQMIVKGQRLPGAVIALFEHTFWLCITASALTGFSDDPLKIGVLVCAFALGNVAGSILEEKLALGFCTVTGVFLTKATALDAAALLRQRGQALTLLPAEGIRGAERTAILTTAKRKDVALIKQLLFMADPNAVITVQATQQVRGATMAKASPPFLPRGRNGPDGSKEHVGPNFASHGGGEVWGMRL